MAQFGIVDGVGNGQPNTYLGAVNAAHKSLESMGIGENDGGVDIGGLVLRGESKGNPAVATFVNSANGVIANIVDTLNFDRPDDHDGKITSGLKMENAAMKDRAMAAAQFGFALSTGYKNYEGRSMTSVITPGEGGSIMNPSALGSKVTLRQEAFNKIDVRRSVAYSIGFNAAITRQTDMVMAWFPPIFINPDQVALEISINLLSVFNAAHHDISGAKTDFKRRFVTRAFADDTVLSRYETQAVPVVRNENADILVDPAVFPAREKQFGNRKVVTAPVRYNTDFNMIGIALTEALIKTGASGHRDVIEPGVKLTSIYIQSGDDKIELKVSGIKTSVFIGAQQGDQMETLLNMRAPMAIGKNLKRYDGGDLTGPLSVLATSDLRVKLQVVISGNANVETCNARVSEPQLSVVSLVDGATGQEITSGPVLEGIKTAVKNVEHIGFEYRAFRTNANRRQIGDIIKTRRFNYHYVIPYRDPITAERPAHKQEEQDAQDLTNLQALTRIRIENEAVATIMEVAEVMEANVDMRETDSEFTDFLGLAQAYLLPVFVKQTIDLRDFVDSVKSSERSRDIQAALVNKLRDIAARMYTDSEFKAGTDVQSGGTLPKPQINVLTDPIIARYLMIDGEIRTLGDFDMVLTTTLNYKVRGKILMSFRMPGQESSNEPCIFNFGHLVMSPELVLSANMQREGSYFTETQYQPRYDFIVLNPILAVLNIEGIKEVLSKVPGFTTITGPLSIEDVVKTQAVGP